MRGKAVSREPENKRVSRSGKSLIPGSCHPKKTSVLLGQGDTEDEAITDVQSAIRYHIESFAKDAFAGDPPLLHAYLT